MNPSPKPADAPLPADDRLLRLVERASSAGRALRRLLADRAAAVQLSDAELLVVWLCGDAATPGMVQGDLAVAIGVSPALMSGLVQRLLERGLIEMQRSTVDRRRQVWRTTDLGRRLLAELRPLLTSLAEQLDGRVCPNEQLAALAMCERLSAAASELSAIVTPSLVAFPSKQGAAA